LVLIWGRIYSIENGQFNYIFFGFNHLQVPLPLPKLTNKVQNQRILYHHLSKSTEIIENNTFSDL